MALSIVYHPKEAALSPTIDIVAVHGLGGDAIHTWTHPKSKAFWLKEFLPQQIPDARIMTFGYNAAAAFGQSTAGVIDHAKSLLNSLVDKREESEEIQRPLIFIAHSLGGIIVKQALFQARLDPAYQLIKDATLSLFFLGTPHRGSDKATFYELRPTKGSGLMLEKRSTLLKVNHEEQIPVDADHSAMCKFETDSDDTFEKVYKRVKWMRNNLNHNNILGSYKQYFEVPNLLSPVFTGRDEDLQRLAVSLAARKPSEEQDQRRYVLFGLGGSGKTQICLKYIERYRERYWGIFWIDASTGASIQQSFTQIAHLLQVDENIDSVRRNLANISQPWLLVFDDANSPDSPNFPLYPYLPTGNRGEVIITSRSPQFQQYNTVGYKEVGQLSLYDSVSLLHKIVYGAIGPSKQDTGESIQVVRTLGCLALAIVRAGAYIRQTSCSFHDYLEIYERDPSHLLQYIPIHPGTGYHSVYSTWQVSVDMIESRHDTASHHALRLLGLLGFFQPDQIPIQIFYNAWHRLQTTQTPDFLQWHDEISDFFDYQQLVQASITLLTSFSLIRRNADASLSLHPLVREWCRGRMSKDEQQLNYRRALWLLIGSVEWKFETVDFAFRRTLVPHVYEFLRLRSYQGELDDEDKIQNWPTLALILEENGWTRDALLLTKEVLQLRKRMLGEDHPDTLTSMHSLAICYSQTGRQTEAIQLMEEVLQNREKILGDGHPDTLKTTHNLAIWYYNAGRRSEALLLIEVLKSHGAKLDENFRDNLNKGSFVDSTYRTASHGQFNKTELVYASTEYSDISTAESKIYTYMECLADDLFSITSSLQSDPQRSRNLCKALPDLLQEFALRIGQERPSKEGREVMAYVHKYRRRVAELFEHFINDNEGQEDSASTHSSAIPFQEKVMTWMTQEIAGGNEGHEDSASIHSTTIPFQEEVNLPTRETVHNFPDEPDHGAPLDTLDSVEKYRGFVAKTPAYSWLLSNMGRDNVQVFQEDDLLRTIHDEIWRCLPPLARISPWRPPVAETLIIKLEWNPIAFILEQGYSEDPSIAIQRAITLTGSPTDAQALSCLEYLNQTWPSSGKNVACLLHKLMRAENGEEVQGGPEATYSIERSRLPPAGADCVLDKVTIGAGKFLTAGINFSIGIKDVPVHISRKPYIQKLRWVSSKFFVFWGEEEKRGWLVNGINALLHLVRASLKHYEMDAFKEALLSKSDDILEPSAESQEAYAISILRNEHNMKLPIYAEKDEVQPGEDDSTMQGLHVPKRRKYYRLEDRVEELYEMLEKLIEHQIDVTAQSGVKMKARVRRRLEGWDFKDLASDKDPISPRVASLHALGKGWVDFVRSIQAVTLFGKGFGQIITSSSHNGCPHWSKVPKGKYYLAACLSDLRQIMETDGDCTTNPVKICNGISWYGSSSAFGACRCAKTPTGNHSDFAQILWPTSLQNVLPKIEAIPLRDDGAVVFGHNTIFRWKWEDTGDPIEGDPSLESSINEDGFHDSGLGLTEISDSRQAARAPLHNSNYEITSQPSQSLGLSDASPEILSARPAIFQDGQQDEASF
ncbi:MAG: hypothetical protein M1816_005549 [Peltula sp. TS41687]|nr:MAG: hypothetical protein M1816_005549 [Peltula sp. TS41687]